MPFNSNIEKLLQHHISNAAFVLDENGNVVTFNEAGKKYLPQVDVDLHFFDLFEKDASQFIERLYLESKNFSKQVKEVLTFTADNIKDEFIVVISPLELEGLTNYLITIEKVHRLSSKPGKEKFTIVTTDIENIIDNDLLIDVIHKLKSSYPFTFIGKTKFQKDIDNLEESFWLKEPDGKFIIVNQVFANSIGMKISQVEGQQESDLLPKYLVKLYKTIDSYLVDTTNTVIVERVATSAHSEKEEKLEIIEFPITDIDNNVVAIVGISRKRSEMVRKSKGDSLILGNILREVSKPIVIIDNRERIISISETAKDYIRVKNSEDVILQPLDKFVDKKFYSKILDLKNNIKQNRNEFKQEITTGRGVDRSVDIILSKLFDSSSNYSGILIEFDVKSENQSQLEMKGKMYDIIMQASPDAMFIYEVDNLKFLEVNDAALKLYGYKRDVFLNMDLTDLYAPEDIQILIESSETKPLGGSFTGPWRHKKSDGTSILVELSKTNLDYNGKKAHLNIVRDVSEQIEKNKKFQIYKTVYENSNDVIINTDKDGFVTYVNEAAVKVLERTKKDLEKRPFLSLVGDDYRAKVNSEIFHSGEKSSQIMDIELKRESGELFEAQVSAIPIIDYLGEIESFNIIIKPEVDYSAEIREKQPSSQGAIDAPFLSNVFHELLTPINVIIGFVQELSESIPKPTDEQKEAIEIIGENQKLLLQLMDNAVEFSMLEQKQVRLKPEELLFTDIVEELKEAVKKTASSNNVEFAYGKISSSLKFQTDKHRFTSLLTLFLKFALQITKEKKIFLSAYMYNNEYCIVSIKDKRGGITPYLLKGLTEIFTDDENQIRKHYGFSRFTVKLTQKLKQLLSVETETVSKGGEVVEFGLLFPLTFMGELEVKEEAETIVVKGETIPIEKPVTQVERIEQPVSTQSVQETSSISVNVNVASPEKKEEKIPGKEESAVSTLQPAEPIHRGHVEINKLSCLYVEDQVDSQILFKVQMKDLRAVEFAVSFENAIPLIKSHRFDFIVMDINLQGEYNGLDALRIIQKMPGYEHIPVIAVTAYVLPGDREKFIAAGFNDFISKPILRDKLMDVLKNIFG